MRGAARPSVARPTVLDPPDGRMSPNPVPKISAERLRSMPIEYVTDPRLRSVDRFFWRWAITHGASSAGPTLARSSPIFASAHSMPTPLDDAESRIVDTAVKSAPDWARKFVKAWYRAQLTVAQIQEELSIKRRQSVYEERELVLAYFLGRLVESGLSATSHAHVGNR